VIEQASELLQRRGRITYRSLKREFALDDEGLEDLKAELLYSHPQVVEDEGRGLRWTDTLAVASPPLQVSASQPQDPKHQMLDARPISYTPPHLAERIRAEQAAMEARGVVDGERKVITALFADLKGSTALIEGLDPEEARAIIDPALQIMMDAVHRYEGYVAQALGDGIFALFGAPIAHEDHPQRALYAALRMQEDLRRYSDELRLKRGVPLYLRVGVNTGEVVVRSIRTDDLHTDYVPVGHSTNLAARMEQLATPGSILITEYTRRLTEGYFDLKPLGAADIKGLEAPLHVYEVRGAGPLRTKLQVAARRGLTRFVGRYTEMEQLHRALEQAQAGHGQIVGVMGEPGLGKSRLFYEFKLTSLGGCLVLEAYSASHGKASPYLPIIEFLKVYFDITPEDDGRKRQEKMLGKVLALDRSLEDTLPYLFALLGIEDQTSSLQHMDPQVRRRRTFEALKKLLLRESLNQPLILIFEDLHWIDSETQGFLDLLSESVASARILLLTNYRPEYRHAWGTKTYYTQLRLTPLDREEAEELLTALLGTAPSLASLRRLILEKTEGTPFFMEEMVQELVEQGIVVRDAVGVRCNLPLSQTFQIPPTVQGVLAARIDRLTAEEKALLQRLAVIGREFPLGLVRQIAKQPEEELYRLLSSLQSKEFLYEQPAFPEVEYIFKHALTQEVAYNSLLLERRKVLHEHVGQAIEEVYRGQLDEHYSELAHHYTRSGNNEKAVEYLSLAGQQAAQRSANTEAVTHLTAALKLLATLPASPAHTLQELILQIALGAILMTVKGYTALETKKAYTRAWELCQHVGETPQIGPVLWALSLFYRVRGDHSLALEPEEQLLSSAQRQQDPAMLLAGHTMVGSHLWWTGSLTAARTHLEQGMRFHDPRQQKSVWMSYGVDVGMLCLTDLALVLWCCGYPEQALKKSQEALSLAQELAHPHSLVLARCWDAWLQQFCRRYEPILQGPTTAAITIATEQGLSFYWGILSAVHGWALSRQGNIEEGLAQAEQGLTLYKENVGEHIVPYLLALLAEAQSIAGRSQEAAQTLTDALTLAEKNGEHFYDAELYRLKGELTLQQGCKGQSAECKVPSPQPEAEAEACFHKAVATARQQQAKSLELRASVSLARLWHQQGKRQEAHDLLADIYGWFTEGFDTQDLQEAKQLLAAFTH
jgi:class 3 adenylate cyclase/predicted ATPase